MYDRAEVRARRIAVVHLRAAMRGTVAAAGAMERLGDIHEGVFTCKRPPHRRHELRRHQLEGVFLLHGVDLFLRRATLLHDVQRTIATNANIIVFLVEFTPGFQCTFCCCRGMLQVCSTLQKD